MRQLIKSLLRFSWAALLLGVRQVANGLDSLAAIPESPVKGTGAMENESGPKQDDAVLRGAHSIKRQTESSSGQHVSPCTGSSPQGSIKTTPFVVLGESLAAGMGDFSLSEETQRFSFPAQMALQMGVPFSQSTIEPPGICHVPGFAPWPVIVPSPLQSTVVSQIPPETPANLSVPNLTLSDAVRLRPREPLIRRNNGHQTAVNLILGLRQIVNGEPGPLPTQLETAVRRRPALAMVALGYAEAIAAAVTGSPDQAPDSQSFRTDYLKVVEALQAAGATVIVLTIPDPLDTAYFSTPDSAASLVKLECDVLLELWHLRRDDLITAVGLNEIAFQLNAASVGPQIEPFSPLPNGSILGAEAANRVRGRVQQLNQTVLQLARDKAAIVCDLNAYIKNLRSTGAVVGGRTLTSEYLGGFYSLNGFYPGATGHALIANEILRCMNRETGTNFPLIHVDEMISSDPVAQYKPAGGPCWTLEDLRSPRPIPGPGSPARPEPMTDAPPRPSKSESKPRPGNEYALRLPPGLKQSLPLNSECSYFGDAISAQNCRTAEAIQWGSGNNLLFGGLAMMDSHLSGNIVLEFTPPEDDWTTFTVSFGDGLTGKDGVLAAPTFYKLPGKQQSIHDVPGHLSTGRLNLRTGEVDSTPGSLNIYAGFFNSALFALLRVNPNFPQTPLSFPGQYGSASALFEQRPDGKLDFTFQGSTFIPLGNETSFPLNFCGPAREYASVPANGTALHPHISITTKSSQGRDTASAPAIPFNTLQEFTLFAGASSFGDLFTLNASETGGPALGRSRLLGRVQIQFGPRAGNSVPIAVSTTAAGGILEPLGRTPLTQLFPGRLTPGPEGFYESLRFPLQTYSLNDLAVIDDPFDLSVGALDLRSGELIHPLLHRGFINQDLLFALLRVEPRTPKNSFFFRGPGKLQTGSRCELVFDFFGEVHIPYPAGFLFPDPNLATGFNVTGGGSLDPYLWLCAFRPGATPHQDTVSVGKNKVSSRGEVFSYSFVIHSAESGTPGHFEYQNHSQQGAFKMHSLAWIDSGYAMVSGTLFHMTTFSCFGTWTKNGVERVVQASAQFARSSDVVYTGIQVGNGGDISNVNLLDPPGAFPVPLKAAPKQLREVVEKR